MTLKRLLNADQEPANLLMLGRDNAEGHKLLQRLVDHVSSSKLHSAEGVDPQATRWMRRTTIGGDYALGRKVAELELESA